MFDFFRRNQPSPKSIERLVKRLTETGGEDGPRVEAAEKLIEWGTPESLYALCKRFTISSKVITQDIEEKRYTVRMLADKGRDAVDPILRFIKKNHQVEWPVQALTQILPKEELVPKLVEALEYVGEGEFTSPEHRTSLIKAMQGLVTPEIANTIRKFLKDDDDDVRIAAIYALAELGDEMREPLLETYIDSADRPRIRIAVADVFANREWPVKGFRPKIEESLPDGFHLTAKGLIRRK
jgi:HEAT repeat protein